MSFWAIFCPFVPPNDPENQHFEKNEKNEWRSYDIYIYTYIYIYGSWNIRCDRQKFLSFSAIFCTFSPLTTQKIKILKLEKTPRDIIILHICTINDNHMKYGSWVMDPDRQNFLSFWTVFALLPPYGPRKSKLWKNKKNTWRYYHFTNVCHKWKYYDV